MTKPPINSTFSKSRALVLLEYILLALCLCVIALRATFTEGPTMRPSTTPDNLGDSLYSLSVSAVLIFAFVLYLLLSFCSKRFLYRLTGIEVGLGLFCVAAVVAGFAASDKRSAITAVAVLLAPPLAAILLVQILDSPSKIKLVLAVIAALGVVSTYQCAEQFFVSNQVTIEQYEKSPQTFLEPLGIEPGTFQQFLFEHRLYTKGVHGFFTTSNSAGSFSLMASFAAIALFIDKLKNSANPVRPRIHIHILACRYCSGARYLRPCSYAKQRCNYRCTICRSHTYRSALLRQLGKYPQKSHTNCMHIPIHRRPLGLLFPMVSSTVGSLAAAQCSSDGSIGRHQRKCMPTTH